MNTNQFYLIATLCLGARAIHSSQMSAAEIMQQQAKIIEQQKLAIADLTRQVLNRELINASYSGNLTEVNKAIQAGADLDSKDYTGNTALIHAVHEGYVAISKALIDAGADLNIKGEDNMTAFMWAVARDAEEDKDSAFINMLLAAGADINAQDWQGDTALMWLARRNLAKYVKVLLKLGADASIKNYKGETIYDIAQGEPLYDIKPKPAIKKVLDDFAKLQKAEHRKALQDVSQKAMEAGLKGHEALAEDLSEQVQEMLRPTPENIVDQDQP